MTLTDNARSMNILEYIVDFFSKDLMLAIEVDGVTHDSATGQQHDRRRQQRLEALGVRFLRFQDEEVKQNLEGVLTLIREWVREKNPPRPSATPPRGDEENKNPASKFPRQICPLTIPSLEGCRVAPPSPSPPWRGAA